MKVIKPAACRRFDDLLMQPRAVVPLHAVLDEEAVGQELHTGTRAMIVVPADVANELLVQAIAPQPKLVCFDGMHTELHRLTTTAPLGPGVAKHRIRQ